MLFEILARVAMVKPTTPQVTYCILLNTQNGCVPQSCLVKKLQGIGNQQQRHEAEKQLVQAVQALASHITDYGVWGNLLSVDFANQGFLLRGSKGR